MPKMKPLKEWVCDTCGKSVDAEDGWLEWISHPEGARNFRITHNKAACYKHSSRRHRADNHLNEFLGVDGLQHLLSMLDVGPLLDPDAKHPPANTRSLTEIIRRLHIPYYEEARMYFGQARADGYFMDNNEAAIFFPSTCKAIVKRYEGQ